MLESIPGPSCCEGTVCHCSLIKIQEACATLYSRGPLIMKTSRKPPTSQKHLDQPSEQCQILFFKLLIKYKNKIPLLLSNVLISIAINMKEGHYDINNALLICYTGPSQKISIL